MKTKQNGIEYAQNYTIYKNYIVYTINVIADNSIITQIIIEKCDGEWI